MLTSRPFGDSMSAAARPQRWGVSRQAKGQEFDPSKGELFTLCTGRGVLLRVPGVTWGGKRKEKNENFLFQIKGFATETGSLVVAYFFIDIQSTTR
jgi:hypothetical protein